MIHELNLSAEDQRSIKMGVKFQNYEEDITTINRLRSSSNLGGTMVPMSSYTKYGIRIYWTMYLFIKLALELGNHALIVTVSLTAQKEFTSLCLSLIAHNIITSQA